MNLLFSYHPIWIFIALAVSLVYTFMLYRKDRLLVDVSKKIKIILSSLRFLSVFIISILLLGIILEYFTTKSEKPLIFIAHDNSESIIQTKDSTFFKTEYISSLQKLSSNLKESYDVVNYSFSNTIENNLDSNYNGKLTNISKVIDQIYSQYSNRNIGAIVLSTDGIYNSGSNPIYSVSRKSYIPVYTIGLGDTSKVRDLKINSVFNNDIAFLGNQFPVEITVSQNDFQSKKVKVSIFKKDKLIKSKTLTFIKKNEIQKINFSINASVIGFNKYTVKIEKLKGEFTYRNNEANFYIDIIDGRQKIALVHSGIHPDLGALASVIENNKNYEVKLIEYKNFSNFQDFDLIICHNYKNENNNLNSILKDGKKPALFIVGTSSNFNDLSNLNIGFSGKSNKSEDINFSLNGNFNSIIYPENIASLLNNAPPLSSPFGSFNFSKSIDILAYQKIGNISLDNPMIYFSNKNTTKYAVIMGEGIWRWRLFDQSKNNTTENFELFFSKIISNLAVKENKNPFKTHIDNEYFESQNINVLAEFYNTSYDLVNSSEVSFNLTNESNKKFDYHFFKTTNAYKLDLGQLEQGIYNWVSSTIFNGVTYKNKGTFLVKEVKKEWLNNTANHRLLKNISQNTNGHFYLPNQLDSLMSDLINREDIVTVTYQEKSYKDLIDYKILFILIILLFSIEWFIRKFNGGY